MQQSYEKYKTKLIETFNELSTNYSNKFIDDEAEKVKLESLIDLWQLKMTDNVLEVGGGPGDLSPFILNRIGQNGSLTFLDLSGKMVEKAKNKLSEFSNIRYLIDDIQTINLSTRFDKIIIFNTFPHFYDKKKALDNCYNHLKPQGSLIICHNSSRWSIVGKHKEKSIEDSISEFPLDDVVFKTLNEVGFTIETFENNEGYNYYLVVARKL